VSVTIARPAATTNAANGRWLALATLAGPVVFNLAWMTLGLLRPGYSFVSRPVSALGIGPNGGLMDAAFVLNGLLLVVGVIAVFHYCGDGLGALARWICTLLLVLSPLGLLWAGIFTMNTLVLHTLGAQIAFATPIVSFPVVGLLLRGAPRWRRFGTLLLVGGPLTLALLIGFIGSVPPSEMATGGGYYGLWQRALGLEVQAWYVALGWLAFRRSSALSAHQTAEPITR
jgi:hypothetical membrane protein